jgi:hypothetical protein
MVDSTHGTSDDWLRQAAADVTGMWGELCHCAMVALWHGVQ